MSKQFWSTLAWIAIVTALIWGLVWLSREHLSHHPTTARLACVAFIFVNLVAIALIAALHSPRRRLSTAQQ